MNRRIPLPIRLLATLLEALELAARFLRRRIHEFRIGLLTEALSDEERHLVSIDAYHDSLEPAGNDCRKHREWYRQTSPSLRHPFSKPGTHLPPISPDEWRDYLPFMVSVINDQSPAWQPDWDEDDFLTACKIHGVAAIISTRTDRQGLEFPQSVAEELREVVESLKVFELLHREQLQILFERFAADSIEFIVLKGSALAYSVSPEPWMRARGDTDLIISESDRLKADGILIELGYEPQVVSSVYLLSYQQIYAMTDRYGYGHIIDIHWRINNRHAFASAFSWQDLQQNTALIPALWPGARTMNTPYQLLSLCLHRVGHFTFSTFDELLTERRDRLLWLYDIFLVCRELDTTAWQQFGELCRAKQLSAVAVDSIDAAAACFPFEFPETIRSALVEAGHKDSSRRLLKGGFINALISELGALPGWQDKAGLVKEHLLPPAEYLLARYEKQSRLWLPLLYIRRLIGYFAP